jgi:undecaprenyl-diphosphatase
MKRVMSFLGRRFTPGEYLGLHLTVGLVFSIACLALYIVVAHDATGGNDALVEFDRTVARDMEQHAAEHPILLEYMRIITHVGGIPAMVALTLLGAAFTRWRRQRLLALVWIIAALGGGLFTLAAKERFDRHRPGFSGFTPDRSVVESNNSFPSGHSMGSVIGYGMLGYALYLWSRRRWQRVTVVVSLTTLVLLIGFSRIYLRAHWASDVLGGFLIGAVWLTVCISGLEIVRRRARRESRPQLVQQQVSPS